MKTKKQKLSRREILTTLQKAFEEIDSGFDWAGFDTSEDDDSSTESLPEETLGIAQEAAPTVEPSSNDDEDDYVGDEGPSENESMYDREDIEIAIDAFLSELQHAQIIHKNKKGRLPSFSDVFKGLFGDSHDLASKAREFETFIEGYFGYISFEDMEEARTKFVEIKSAVKVELEIAERKNAD